MPSSACKKKHVNMHHDQYHVIVQSLETTNFLFRFNFIESLSSENYTLSLHDALPIFDSIPKAIQVVAQVNEAHRDSGQRPLVFSSIVDDEVRMEKIGRAHV